MTVVEAFEVDLIHIDPRPKIFEHLWSAIPIRHETSQQSGILCLPEYGHTPFRSDQWLGVRADQNLRPLADRISRKLVRGSFQRRRDCVRIAKRLRCDPILAIPTVEVATQHAEAIGESSRPYVKERLF